MSSSHTHAGFAGRRRAVASALRRRLVAHLAAGGTTDFAPDVLENDPACYTDPHRAAIERRELFLTRPIVAGLSCDIPSAGDCLLVDDLGPSVVIVRGADGVVRGFLNMCTHRASRIVSARDDGTCERRTRLTCPFHAWTFDLEGALIGIPGRAGFDGATAGRGLIPVAAAEWNGLVFVQVEGTGAIDLPGHLGTFADELAQLELGDASPIRQSRLTADCNWKMALDTYAEGYHFATLHASTIGVSHYSNIAVFDDFGPHWRMHFPDKTMRALVDLPEHDWPEVEYGGIHFLFPNVVLVVGASGPGRTFVRMFRLFPGDTPGRMSCRIGVYEIGGAPGDDRSAFAQDDAESEVTLEDYRVAVDGYRNLVHAPPGFRMVYGRNEPALQSLHRHIAARIGGGR